MTPDIEHGPRANFRGSLFMVAAMAGFAIEDTFLKAASLSLPIAQVLVLFGGFGTLLFTIMAILNRERVFSANVVSRPMRVRAGFEVVGRLFYTLALALTPLSAATVILQATPLVVVAGAALVFGEKVGWRRWAAILIGLLGVVVIVQPGTEGFSALSILAVLGMLGFAGRDLASRAAPKELGAAVLGIYGFAAIMVAGLIYAIWERQAFLWPGATIWFYLFAAAVTGGSAYACLMKAMRTGDVSAVTPFRYTRLIFGIGLGVILFGERLDMAMVIGCGLIVLSGLFILWRGKNTSASH